MSAYSRNNYKHKRERLPSSNTRGGRAQAQRADPGSKNKAMHEAGKAGQEQPAARLRPRKDKG